jgi:hypothetical protein
MKQLIIKISFILLCIAFFFVPIFCPEVRNHTPGVAVISGILFAVFFGNPFIKYTSKITSQLLGAAIVGMGFGMNLIEVLSAGANGFIYTFIGISVGLGFLIAISIIASIREILGYGTLTFIGGKVLNFMPVYDFFGVEPTEFFGSNPGAFIVLAIFLGSLQSIFIYKKKIKIRKGA